MSRPLSRALPLAVVFTLAFGAAALAGEQAASPDAPIRLTKALAAGHKNFRSLSASACTTIGTTCGATIQGSLDTQDCVLNDGTYADNYTFQGTAGQTVTINMTSGFDSYLILLNPSGTIVAFDDDGGGGKDSRIVFTLTSTGIWTIRANSAENPETGPYTVTLSCGAPSTCVPNATSMCLNGRFRVSANWQTATASGAGTPVQLTSDTGYFWFFSSSNVEMVIKVLNGCGFNSHYWTFAGGLTDVLVNLTVTDTQTGAVRNYANPQHQAFLPIQDTSAFSTCP